MARAAALGVVVGLGALAGCTPMSSSGIQTGGAGLAPHVGTVGVAATFVPQGAREVGIVQAVGQNANIEDLVPVFAARVAAMGGDYGLVESIRTTYEMTTSTESYTYSCGTTQSPQTCYGTRTVTHEVATTQMLGRAFLQEVATP